MGTSGKKRRRRLARTRLKRHDRTQKFTKGQQKRRNINGDVVRSIKNNGTAEADLRQFRSGAVHRIVELRNFPDDTQTWVCACGDQGTSYQSIDLVNRDWAAHRAAHAGGRR